MIYLSQRDHTLSKWAGLQEISEAIDSPVFFTSKILQQLSKANLILSVRGPRGGFKKLDEGSVSLIDVIHAIDGKKITQNCVLGFGGCNMNHPCALHFKFLEIRKNMNKMLEETSMQELGKMVENDNVFLKKSLFNIN